jgi:hypothetical protein
MVIGVLVYVIVAGIVGRNLTPLGAEKKWQGFFGLTLLSGRKYFTERGWKIMNMLRLIFVVWIATLFLITIKE